MKYRFVVGLFGVLTACVPELAEGQPTTGSMVSSADTFPADASAGPGVAEGTDDTSAEPPSVSTSGDALSMGFGDSASGGETVSTSGLDSSTTDMPADTGSGTEETGDSVDPGPDLASIGCADGEREGFVDLDQFPNIAACGGGWSIAGVVRPMDTCGRAGGDDGTNPTGTGCAPQDLCAVGWHVCASAQEVARNSPMGCEELEGIADSFWLTRQSGPGGGACGEGSDDLFGCGTVGFDTFDETCGPLDRGFSAVECGNSGSIWVCSDVSADGTTEASLVTKTSPQGGGVLCCND